MAAPGQGELRQGPRWPGSLGASQLQAGTSTWDPQRGSGQAGCAGEPCVLRPPPLIASRSPWIVPSHGHACSHSPSRFPHSLAASGPQQRAAVQAPATLGLPWGADRLQLWAAPQQELLGDPGGGGSTCTTELLADSAWGSSSRRLLGLSCAQASPASTERSPCPARPEGPRGLGRPHVWPGRPPPSPGDLRCGRPARPCAGLPLLGGGGRLVPQGEENRAMQEEPTQLSTRFVRLPVHSPSVRRELLAEGEGPASQSGRDLAAPRGWDTGAPSGVPCPSVFLPSPPPPPRLLCGAGEAGRPEAGAGGSWNLVCV